MIAFVFVGIVSAMIGIWFPEPHVLTRIAATVFLFWYLQDRIVALNRSRE